MPVAVGSSSSVGLINDGKQIRRRSFAPFVIIRRHRLSPSEHHFDGQKVGFPSYYYRLPEHHLKLSIVKLDDSSFEVEVGRSATVIELKLAVEDFFARRCNSDKEETIISWSHVWSHFCLCYNDQKLINDNAQLHKFGINDGDELRFSRHLSIDYRPAKRASVISKGVSMKKKKKKKKKTDDGGGNEGINKCTLLARMVPWWLCYTRVMRLKRKED